MSSHGARLKGSLSERKAGADEIDRSTPMLDRFYYVARNRKTGEVLQQQGRAGEPLERPTLFISARRVKQGLSARKYDVDCLDDWEIIKIRLAICA